MLPDKQGFGGPAAFQPATEGLSCSSSFGSTSINAMRAVPNSISDSQFTHMEVSRDSKDDSSKPLSLAEKKLQRLARNRATASVSRSRKREHLHTLQMRLSALEQENKDLVQQVAVRDAELKRFKRERGEPGDCMVVSEPEPVTEQIEAKSPKEIIVCPATSALPRILCNTGIPASSQAQARTCLQAGTSSHGGAGSKHKAAPEPHQKLSRQRSSSATHSADDSPPLAHVKFEASRDCLMGPAQQQPPAPAVCEQAQRQATFNTVTSGEYSHLTIKRQLSVKPSLPGPMMQQPEVPAVDSTPHQAQAYSTFPAGEDGYSAPDLHRGSSHSFDSCYLPVGDMPDFGFEAGNGDMSQEGLWAAGQDAQIPHAQLGINVESAAQGEAGSLGGQSKPWDWCSVMAQSLEQAPPCMPDLPPLPELPPALCTRWEQQAWQASWQQQQQEPQHSHPHDQQHHFQHPFVQPFVEVDLHPTCSKSAPAAAGMEFMDPAGCSGGAEAAWLMLPSCSMENMLQPDAACATGDQDNQKAAAGKNSHVRGR